MAWRREVTVRVAVYGTILIVLVTLARSVILLTVCPRMAGNTSSAVAAMRAYLGAQGTFQREDRYGKGKLLCANPVDGVGFPDLYRVGGPLDEPDGTELKLISLDLARATSPETAWAGYWFVDIVGDAVSGKHYDYTKECGLCGVPAVHGKTGLHTFVIDIRGTVYKKDNGGKPVTVFPDVKKDGWRPVGS
jgi:hypothetical protein